MKMIFPHFIACIVCIMTFSCKKTSENPGPDGDGTEYYVKFRKDNVDFTYKGDVAAQVNTVLASGDYMLAVSGLDKPFVADKDAFTISISNSDKINTTTTYVNYTTTSSGYLKATLCSIAFFNSAGTFFGSWGDELSFSGVTSDTKINVIEMNNTYVKGTFSGTTYEAIDGSSEKHIITNGEFYAPVK